MDFVHWQAPAPSEGRPKSSSHRPEEHLRSHPPRPLPSSSPSLKADPDAANGEKRVDRGAEAMSGPERCPPNNVVSMGSGDEPEEPEMSTRPRLTQEQVIVLESQFQAHPKPSSSTKRQLADQTSLSLPRVANWFQNRRAKAKQQKRQADFDMVRSLDAAGRANYHELSSPDLYMPETFFTPEFNATPRQSMIAGHGAPEALTYTEPSIQPVQQAAMPGANYAPFPTAGQPGVMPEPQQDAGPALQSGSDMSLPLNIFTGDFDTGLSMGSTFSDWGSSADSSLPWTPSQQLNDPFDLSIGLPQGQFWPQGPQAAQMEDPGQSLGSSMHEPKVIPNHDQTFTVPALPYQMLQEQQQQEPLLPTTPEIDIFPDQAFARRDSSSSLANELSAVDIQSPHEPSPVPEQSIAARRKRPPPAALVKGTMRSHTHMGAMTTSPTAKAPPFLSNSRTVRRIKSYGGNLNLARGRIQKTCPGSAQRSPLNITTFAEAGMFGDVAGTHLSPVTPSYHSSRRSSSLAPPTPLSPIDLKRLQSDSSLNTMGHNDQTYIFNSEYPGCFVPTSVETQPNLASPPTTPHDRPLYAHHHQPPGPVDHALRSPVDFLRFNSQITDSPMVSPHCTSFPSEAVHMPQPIYASPVSCGDPDMAAMSQHQPLSQRQHSTDFGTGNRQPPVGPGSSRKGESKPLPEFCFEDPAPKDGRAPPPPPPPQQQPRHRNYVFANQTPDDF